MVFGEESITNISENGHTLCSADSLKVLIHNLPHEVNILSDLALGDHRQRLIRIFMEGCKVPVVFNYPHSIIVDVRKNHWPIPQLT